MGGGKTVLHNNVTGASGGFSIVEGTRSSHADSFYIDMTKECRFYSCKRTNKYRI